jgi:hypothetical protein
VIGVFDPYRPVLTREVHDSGDKEKDRRTRTDSTIFPGAPGRNRTPQEKGISTRLLSVSSRSLGAKALRGQHRNPLREDRANALREDLSQARHALETARSGPSWGGVALGLAIVCLALAAVIGVMKRRLRDVRFDAAMRTLVEDQDVNAGV